MSEPYQAGTAPARGVITRAGAAVLARTTLQAAFQAPLTTQARRNVLYCLISMPLGLATFMIVVVLLPAGLLISGSVLGTVVGLMMLVLNQRLARRFGGWHRRLADRFLNARVMPPTPFRRPAGSVIVRLDARLRDGTGWRATGYLLLKLPVLTLQYFALGFWACGLYDLGFPLWWLLFRNHPAATTLRPLPTATPPPFNSVLHISTWAATLWAALFGVALLLAAPWLTRGAVAVDRWLIRSLLGPGTLAQRVRDLELARSRAVDDSAALLRQVERDLHDGAQVRLAAMAMNLGMAKEKLGHQGVPDDIGRIRELVDAAHLNAKEALVELRELVRGIHPPVLDTGLGEALATLAAGSAIPVTVSAEVTERPSPAIETIAYFCAAELLTNAIKYSQANKIDIAAALADGDRGQTLRLQVSDDGIGGADPEGGSGLAGLRRRVGTVDGDLRVDSPPGGPTEIVVELPMTA
ncbi:MAG: sensor domain-containing protein [Actinobacteria bacterium]|nr:sensor domain-containing protein [Actinomycetota bacterium]